MIAKICKNVIEDLQARNFLIFVVHIHYVNLLIIGYKKGTIMKVALRTKQTPIFQGAFKKTPKLMNEISRYNNVEKFETINLLNKISEVKDNKVYEYTGKTIIDVEEPHTFVTAYAVETNFLHRLKRFVSVKYQEAFNKKELDETVNNILR